MATENEQSRREWRRLIIFCLAALVVGIGMTSLDIVFGAREAAKAERLRAHGVPVVAFASDFDPIGSSRTYPASIKVTYTFQDYGYRKRIECGDWESCRRGATKDMTLWVDPADPKRFVAENGSTDLSLTPRPGRWLWIFFALLGTAGLILAWYARRERAKTRRGRPRRRREPAPER